MYEGLVHACDRRREEGIGSCQERVEEEEVELFSRKELANFIPESGKGLVWRKSTLDVYRAGVASLLGR